MTTTQTETITPEINAWTKPGTGEVRRYINNWHELAGFTVTRYNTGNISSVKFGDELLSNRKGGLAICGKVWIDSNDELHFDRHAGDAVTIDQKRAAIIEALAAHGIAAH